MAENTKPLWNLPFDERMEIENKLWTTRAVADVLMCGGAENCAPETVHALGEIMYYQLSDVETALGLNPEPRKGEDDEAR